MSAGSYFIGASGSGGGSVTQYVDSGLFSGSTGSNNIYVGGGGWGKSIGMSYSSNSNGFGMGVAKYGPGYGLLFADGKQHYATGRINW